MKHKKSTAYPIIFAAILSAILIILANLKATGESGQIASRLTLQEDLINAQYDIENTYNFIIRATEIIIDQSYIELAQNLPTPCSTDPSTSAIILKDQACEVFETTQPDNFNKIITEKLNQKIQDIINNNPDIKPKVDNLIIELQASDPANPQTKDVIVLSGQIVLDEDINPGLKTKLKKQISFVRENRLIKIEEVIQNTLNSQIIDNNYYSLSNIQQDSTNPDCKTAELALKGKIENLIFQSNTIPIKVCPQHIPALGPSLTP